MDIQEIKRRVELLQAATLQKSVLVKDVAKELKESQTDLMQFILDNPKLFHTDEVWSWKKGNYKEMTRFGAVRSTRAVKDKCKGLGIAEVYLCPEDNFRTDEHVAILQSRYARTVWLKDWNNYGTIEGHYVEEDAFDAKDEHRKHLWRNTAAKITELKNIGILRPRTFYIGGAFDCSEHDILTAIDGDGIAKAESLGWTLI